MDERLMNLRQRAIECATELILAQRVYLEATAPDSRKSSSEMKEAAEGYLAATEPYDAALQELRRYLLAAGPSEAISAELERTEHLIETLDKEKTVGLKLIERHAEKPLTESS